MAVWLIRKMGKSQKTFNKLQKIALLLTVLQLVGCSTPLLGHYGTEGRSREDFAKYVEEVFRLQNTITSQMMILMESGEINLPQPLMSAEQRMHDQCSSINEYVSRDMDGQKIGILLRRNVAKSAESCGKAAHEVEGMLNGL